MNRQEIIDNKANLRGAHLEGANLENAYLIDADLENANLENANLENAYLIDADLENANLIRANLWGANLEDANLRGANLEDANLRRADLKGADLEGANLRRADLEGANLLNTVLDPNNKPNNDTREFQDDPDNPGYCIGYRTREAGHIDMYRDGWTYSADFFSTAPTECHPGLYLWPTMQAAIEFSGKEIEYIQVSAPKDHIHKAGSKYRCRWFTVIGSISINDF